MSSAGPLVSVLIPAYNRADLLPRAVRSVVEQQFDDLEILVVDDGSADDTTAVLETLAASEPRLRFVRHQRNRGEAAARNTAIEHARGELVAFLDSDDEWLPGKLHRQLGALSEAGDDCAGVLTGQIVIAEDGSRQFEDAWHYHRPITLRNLLVHGCGIGLGSNVLMRTAKAREAGPFDETLPLFVDVDWLCRFLEHAVLLGIGEPYAVYYKAPMRPGGRIEAAAGELLTRIPRQMQSLSWRDRARARAQLLRSAAAGYRAEGDRRGLARVLSRSLLLDPIVPPGNYVELLDAVLDTRLVDRWRSARRRRAGPPTRLGGGESR